MCSNKINDSVYLNRFDDVAFNEICPFFKNREIAGYGVKFPKGTVIHLGEISSQGGIFLGGTQQILIEAPWKLKGIEVVEQFSLKQEQKWQYAM